MTENRVRSISNILAEPQRLEAYSRLLDAISSETAPALNQDELQELAWNLPSENVVLIQNLIWNLLVSGEAIDSVRAFALKMLQDHSYRNRGEALLYLRSHYPELMPQLHMQYCNDVDTSVRYQLTE